MKPVALLAVIALTVIRAEAARFPVEPMTVYRTEKATDIQFYDAEGRAIFLGTHANAKLVASPMDAVSANVPLKPVEITPAGITIDDPAFWCERSLVEVNTGDRLRVRPGGYAVSIFLPACFDYRATRDPADKRKPDEYDQECMFRLWYDRDMREIGNCRSFHLGADAAPKEAVYVRFLIPWSQYDNFQKQQLFRPYWNEDHRYYAKRGTKDSEIFKNVPKPVFHPGEIVLGPSPDCREVYAAAELVRETKTVTGKVLPVVTTPTKGSAFRIHIGRKAAERAGYFRGQLGGKSELAEKLEGTDGYAIRRKGRDIYVFGALPLGTIYASMKLLENLTDFCWWRPERGLGLSFTPRETIDFASAKDCDDRPVFRHRTFYCGWCPCNYAYDDWALRHGLARIYRPGRTFGAIHYHAKSRGFICALGANFVDLAMRGNKSREEFGCVVNGKRKVGAGQPCYSNPEVVKATVANVNRILDDAPEEWDYFFFEYIDSWQCCECAECLKPIRLPQGGELACKDRIGKDSTFRSTRTYMVANEVAKAVTSRFPAKKTLMYAYIYTAAPPEVKLHPSLRVNYATYASASMRFSSMEQDAGGDDWPGRTARWCEREPQAMGMYEYYGTSAPGMYAEVAAANLRQMADVGGTFSVYTESMNDGQEAKGPVERPGSLWNVNAVEQVLIASLFWNPYQDVGKARSEVLRRIYGDGAADMEEFYRLFATRWFDRSFKTWMNCHTPMPDVYTEFVIKPKIEEKVYAAFDRALAKVKAPAAKRHLERMISVYREMRRATGRVDIPAVPELAGEWKSPTSPQWEKAFTLKDFRDALPDPDDPAQMTCDLAKTPPPTSKTKTRVDFACDSRYLYWRVEQDGRGGYTELRFGVGKFMDAHSFFTTGKTRLETGRVPMAAIREDPAGVIHYIVRRFDAKGNCSFGRGLDNVTRAYPGQSAPSYSKLCPSVDSVFDPSDDRNLGFKAKPPMSFSDPEVEKSPLRKLFSIREELGGQGMRRVRGVPVFDTGFGYCIIKAPGDIRPGDEFEFSGERWCYGWYTPFLVSFYDEKGVKISEGSYAWGKEKFKFRVSCPPGTKSIQPGTCDSYIKSLKIEKVSK